MSLSLAERNPELRRQLWLAFSLTRLIGMPAVLGLVFFGVAMAGAEALSIAAHGGFVLLVWAYGSRLASAALLDEVAEATWDAQRLSSLTPWQLTWGKLVGGTAYAWYGGLFCLGVSWSVALATGEPLPLLGSIGVVAGGIAVQAVSLILSLAALRRGHPSARRGGAWWVVLLVGLPWLGGLPFRESDNVLQWWGLSVPTVDFYMAISVVFAGWAVLGAHRMMATALQVPQRPVVWMAFHVWLAVFLAGFGDPQDAPWRMAVVLTVVASTTAYASLFFEPPRLDPWQRLAARWREGGFGRATQQQVPLMAASALLAVIGGLLCAALAPSGAALGLPRGFGTVGLALTLALLTLRDLGVACAVHWSPQIKRPEGATLVLLALINLVLPWMLSALGLHTLASWLQPLIGPLSGPTLQRVGLSGNAWLPVSIAALQAGIAFAVALAQWRTPGVGQPGAARTDT